MTSWFDWFPEFVEQELESYRRNSISVEVDENSRARGIFSLIASIEEGEATYRVRVDYPSLFPYFQPMAFLLDETLSRHQAPEGGHLCLLGRGTDQWDSSDHFGDVIAQRFPIILEINRQNDLNEVAKLEEPQGEPFTEYLNGAGVPGSALIYQDSWRLPAEIMMGMATLKCARVDSGKKSAAPIVGFISSISKKADTLAQWDGPSFEQYSSTLHIPWVRLAMAPKAMGQALIDELSDNQKSHVGLNNLKRNQPTTFLVIFPEEAEQFQYRDGIACITLHPRVEVTAKGKTTVHGIYYQRTFRSGAPEMFARMPGVSELPQKTVAIFGLGALGSFVSIELARAGLGSLRLVDFDYVEPATVRRWVLGASAFGQQKAKALSDYIRCEYPWTTTFPTPNLKIGNISDQMTSKGQFEEIVDILDGCDVVIDLTAEFGVNEFLAMLASRMDVPYLRGSATPGAWGGYIAHFNVTPDRACWVCMTHDLYGDTFADDLPPSDPAGTLQPPGCPSITFTGTSVDLQEISMEVVRQTLGIVSTEYPLPPEQMSIVRLRDENGGRMLPAWTNRKIKRRENCKCN
jgi:hypothetical protein